MFTPEFWCWFGLILAAVCVWAIISFPIAALISRFTKFFGLAEKFFQLGDDERPHA